MIYIETEKVELKRCLNENFEKEVVAFLNSFDGIIYIGVEDNGVICGINKIDETMHKISDIITNNIKPNPIEFIEVRLVYENSKYVVEVKVKKGKALYYINKYGRSSKGCYIRVGTSTRSMSEEQIEKTFLSYIIPKFSLIKERSPKQKLTFKVFKIYLDENRIYYNDDNFIENNNLVNENGEYNYQAFLLSDQCDISIKIACWEGKNKLSNYLFKKEFGRCCILKAMDDLSSYMESTHNKVKSYFDKGKLVRRDEYLFDFVSFREAWVNACLHNDYSTHLGPAVYLFNDHMEIFSYGSPLRVQSKDKFLNGTSNPINPELASIFIKLDNAEESGKGINTIINNYGKDVFEFSESDLIIRIPYNEKLLNYNGTQEASDTQSESQSESQNYVCGVNDTQSDTQNGTQFGTQCGTQEVSDTQNGTQFGTQEVSDTQNGTQYGTQEASDTQNGTQYGTQCGTQEVSDTQNGTKCGTQCGTQEASDTFDSIDLIIKYIKSNNKITRKELADKLKISVRSLQRIINDNNKIKFIGSGKSGYWKIIE